MENLKNVALMVKKLLEYKPETRSSDEVLYLELIKVCSLNQGRDLTSMSVSHFFNNRKIYCVPGFETVRRARQKVQQVHPELKAVQTVEDARAELVGDYRAFALSESV